MKGKNKTPRIYVACLAAYNNGKQHGQWINVSDGEDAVLDQISEVLKSSLGPDAEEHAIYEYEGFCGLQIEEYDSIESVLEKAEFIEEYGHLGAEVVEHFGGDIEDARRALNDHYAGEYRSLAEFTEELTEQTTQIPETFQYYIDYDRMARDLEMNEVFTVELGFEEIHVFWSR